MNRKSLASAAAVAAAVTIYGCASSPPTPPAGTSPGETSLDCKNKKCDVPVSYHFPGTPTVPDYVEVDAKTLDAVVTVAWDLSSILGARFDPKTGIVFVVDDNHKPKTACAPVGESNKVFSCDISNLKPKTDYKYTITLVKGVLTPYPLDPFIRN